MSVVSLNGTNYPSWKVQCRMALIREGLWGIVAGTEEPPNRETDADKYAKFMSWRDKALATIVLAVHPTLLYLIGDPEDPAAVWRKLSGQFQKKTWANKLSLRKRLFTMKLGDSGSMRDYVKKMTEIFDELAVVAEPVSDEDKVVHLLAGLPESYDVLVTALESGSDTVPGLESVTERLLREEQKLKDREEANDGKKLLLTKGKKPFTRAAEAGKTAYFGDSGCEFLNEENETIALGVRQGSLYYLKFAIKSREGVCVARTENKGRLWHRRFGHLNEQSMQKLVREGLINQLDYTTSGEIGVCEACIGGKQCKNSFKPSKTVTSKPLELVHSDVCGKMGQKSLGGAEYFLTLLDDKTHHAWVYPLKTKDQVFEFFKQWQAEVENFTGQRVKTLRTDNGGEFTSKSFPAHLKACGIRHELTIPKTPEQNGVAERLNRTLVETTRAMLLDAKLPHIFWAEAISTAAYLRNRSPTSAVEGTTPHQAWYGQKPRVEHLRVFGSAAYVHIPKDERGKLDPKSKKCVLLGYGSVQKGYRVYDRLTWKVFYSRNVKFDERETDGPPVEEENPAQHPLILDSVDESESDGAAGDEEESSTNPDLPVAAEPPPRRSTREKRSVDYYGLPQAHLTIHREPTTFDEATACPEKAKWKEAMGKEMKSLEENKVWELIPLPPGKKAIGSKWVYKVKTNSDGSFERYKARLVARGFDQKFGSDYDETFCPVVRMESLRTLMSLSTQRGLELHHVDVHTAFLNGTLVLQEEVYMKQPPGYEKEGEEHLVCRLSKSIYGLKQSSRCWNMALDAHLKSVGFSQLKSGPCIYVSGGEDSFYIRVYVDDMILAGNDKAKMKSVKKKLSSKFDIKELGKPLGGPTTILEDNQSSNAMARNPQFHGRAKHIDIKHHFVRERVSDGSIELKYCPTNEMVADILTKGLAHQQPFYERKLE